MLYPNTGQAMIPASTALVDSRSTCTQASCGSGNSSSYGCAGGPSSYRGMIRLVQLKVFFVSTCRTVYMCSVTHYG